MVGFIGPEYLFDGKQITRAGLEDHFCGKLLGLPMGVDVCYTNHAEADQDDMDTLLTLLVAAGVNFVMGVPGADDIMLGYQSTSFHDALAMRDLFGRRPAPEFEAWLMWQGLMDRRGEAAPARAGAAPAPALRVGPAAGDKPASWTKLRGGGAPRRGRPRTDRPVTARPGPHFGLKLARARAPVPEPDPQARPPPPPAGPKTPVPRLPKRGGGGPRTWWGRTWGADSPRCRSRAKKTARRRRYDVAIVVAEARPVGAGGAGARASPPGQYPAHAARRRLAHRSDRGCPPRPGRDRRRHRRGRSVPTAWPCF